MPELLFSARVATMHYEATDVISVTLVPIGAPLPERIDPGSHVDIHLPNGLMRSYSLSNGPGQTDAFRLTIARDENSRGGSTYIHDMLRVGQVIDISYPRNNFWLNEKARMSVFIAGGIGATPFLPMVARLNEIGKPWRLHYCVRSRDRAALLDEFQALAACGAGEVIPNFDDESTGLLDLSATIAATPQDAHLYCCGPNGMLSAFREIAAACGIPSERIHFEYFSSDVRNATEGGFTVVLHKSDREIHIEPGQSILQALIAHNVDVPYSCEEGICGACETAVIEGVPDHRDMILSESERQASKTMMICCSGSRSDRLVLDL